MTDRIEGERISRDTLPTVSYTLTNSLKRWVEETARARNVKKSVIVREALEEKRVRDIEVEAIPA